MARLRTTLWLSTLFWMGGMPVAWAEDCVASGNVVTDCDGDGYSEAEGDCDDANPEVRPERSEDCDTPDDDDCDGYPNAGCPNDVARGSLRGGSACEQSGTSAWVFVVLPGLAGLRRRRAAGAA